MGGSYSTDVGYKILMIGPAGSGKNFLLQALTVGADNAVNETHTPGFETANLNSRRTKILYIIYNLSGEPAYRKLYKYFYPGTEGIIFMVNCADPNNIREASVDLDMILDARELRGLPILVIANKVDHHGAMDMEQLKTHLRLEAKLARRFWWICQLRNRYQFDVDIIMDTLDNFVQPRH
ncbi:ADP-ribosylation factor 6-like [Gigantopelta aegis]|uniref:ADP-ribosylation factor 6-like n=1 Tax=Gigantopelta aegis TaxID=1735272 RepID=UPI001B8886DF|nr:ADP-ribosylation factor 6-like [Gigantopelta aegis]